MFILYVCIDLFCLFLADDGYGSSATFSFVSYMTVHAASQILYAVDTGSIIRSVNLTNRYVTTVCGSSTFSSVDGSCGGSATLMNIKSLQVNQNGTMMYIATGTSSSLRVIDMRTKTLTTLINIVVTNLPPVDGPLLATSDLGFLGMVLSPDDSYLLLTDYLYIRKFDLVTNNLTTIAGSVIGQMDGVGTQAAFGKKQKTCCISINSYNHDDSFCLLELFNI